MADSDAASAEDENAASEGVALKELDAAVWLTDGAVLVVLVALDALEALDAPDVEHADSAITAATAATKTVLRSVVTIFMLL